MVVVDRKIDGIFERQKEREQKRKQNKSFYTRILIFLTPLLCFALPCLALPLPLIGCYIHFYLLIIIPSFLNNSGPITLLSSHSFCPITSCQLVLTVAITYDVFGCITELEVELIAENSSPADQRVFFFI